MGLPMLPVPPLSVSPYPFSMARALRVRISLCILMASCLSSWCRMNEAQFTETIDVMTPMTTMTTTISMSEKPAWPVGRGVRGC